MSKHFHTNVDNNKVIQWTHLQFVSFAIAPVVLLIVLLKRRSGGGIANESTVRDVETEETIPDVFRAVITDWASDTTTLTQP